MDLFLRFLILGGKYLSQLTAQSIVEAYRRSIQLGHTLNVHTQHAVAVVTHYDNMLEMYQRNLDEFQALPHAHMAFISEQHRQEFESYMHDSGLVSDEDVIALFKQGILAAEGSAVTGDSCAMTVEPTCVQQMAHSILGNYAKGRTPYSASTSPRLVGDESGENVVDIGWEDVVIDVDYTAQDNVKSYNCLSPRTAHAMNMFRDAGEPDGALNTVAEYLDQQAEYIKCANDTFKQLQVDIANKYMQMQQQAVQEQAAAEEIEREKLFTLKLKTVQKEVESCTKLMKHAQGKVDINDDQKTKRLFESIDKIIKDVEAVTCLMKVNEEHFKECEELHALQEKKGSPDLDHSKVMDENLYAYDKLVCNMISKKLKEFTTGNNLLACSAAAASSSLVPIDGHILRFLDKSISDPEREKLLEVNEKAFEKTEKIMKYPLIGRWNNHLKKSRKSTNLSREKNKNRNRKSNLNVRKKTYKCSKIFSNRSPFTGQLLQRRSNDEILHANFAALSSTWIHDGKEVDVSIGNTLMGPPDTDPKPYMNVNSAIKRFLRRQAKSDYSVMDRKPTPKSGDLLVVDERLDFLVEQLLHNMKDSDAQLAEDRAIKEKEFAADELKQKAFTDIKKEINASMQECRREIKAKAKDPIAFKLKSMDGYIKAEQDDNQQCVEIDFSAGPVMFDGIPVEVPEFEVEVEGDTTNRDTYRTLADYSEFQDLEAQRRVMGKDSARMREIEDVRRQEELKELRRQEARLVAQIAETARREADLRLSYQPVVKEEKYDLQTTQSDAQVAYLEPIQIYGGNPLMTSKNPLNVTCQHNDHSGYSVGSVQSTSFPQRSVRENYRNPEQISLSQNSLKIEISQNGKGDTVFQMETSNPCRVVPVNSNSVVIRPRAGQGRDCKVARSDTSLEPVEIDIAYPPNKSTANQISLSISLPPSLEDHESGSVDYQETSEPSQGRRQSSDINTTKLMGDIVSELNEKQETRSLVEWKKENKLLHLAREMNYVAALRTSEEKIKSAAGKQLQHVFDLEKGHFGVNPEVLETVPRGLSAQQVENKKSEDFGNVTVKTLKWVDDMFKQPQDNPKLIIDVTGSKSVSGFRKPEVETRNKWNKWRNMASMSRKICKSYTVVKTRTNEITLMDMINGGSRSLCSSSDKITGTRHISNTSANSLKPAKACTTLRRQSQSIKLIPMNLLQQSKKEQESARHDKAGEEEMSESMKATNAYRVVCAKSFAKPASSAQTMPEIEVEPLPKTARPLTSEAPLKYPVELEKIIEASSSLPPKEFLQLPSKFLVDKAEKTERPMTDLKISFKSSAKEAAAEAADGHLEEEIKEDEEDESMLKYNQVNTNQAMSQIKNIRKNQEDHIQKRIFTYVSPEYCQASGLIPPAPPTSMQHVLMASQNKEPKEEDDDVASTKNSIDASIDGSLLQDITPSTKMDSPPMPLPRSSNAGKPDVRRSIPKPIPISYRTREQDKPQVELKKFQYPSKPQSAPSASQLKEQARGKGLRHDRFQGLQMKTPDLYSVKSKSDETMRTVNSEDVEYTEVKPSRLLKVAPGQIMEESAPRRRRWSGYSSQNDGGHRGASTGNENQRGEMNIQLNIPDRPGPPAKVCDYDIQYKYETPEVAATSKPSRSGCRETVINPAIREAVESYHNKMHEQSVKKAKAASKILFDYNRSESARANYEPEESQADDVSIKIKVLDENENVLSDEPVPKITPPMKPYQLRNQSSMCDTQMAPLTPQSYAARVRPTLELPKLDVIAEQIIATHEHETASEKVLPVKSRPLPQQLPQPTPHVPPQQLQHQILQQQLTKELERIEFNKLQNRVREAEKGIENEELNVKGLFTEPSEPSNKKQVKSAPKLPSSYPKRNDRVKNLKYQFEPVSLPETEHGDSEECVTPPEMKSFFAKSEEPVKVELLNPDNEERTVFKLRPPEPESPRNSYIPPPDFVKPPVSLRFSAARKEPDELSMASFLSQKSHDSQLSQQSKASQDSQISTTTLKLPELGEIEKCNITPEVTIPVKPVAHYNQFQKMNAKPQAGVKLAVPPKRTPKIAYNVPQQYKRAIKLPPKQKSDLVGLRAKCNKSASDTLSIEQLNKLSMQKMKGQPLARLDSQQNHKRSITFPASAKITYRGSASASTAKPPADLPSLPQSDVVDSVKLAPTSMNISLLNRPGLKPQAQSQLQQQQEPQQQLQEQQQEPTLLQLENGKPQEDPHSHAYESPVPIPPEVMTKPTLSSITVEIEHSKENVSSAREFAEHPKTPRMSASSYYPSLSASVVYKPSPRDLQTEQDLINDAKPAGVKVEVPKLPRFAMNTIKNGMVARSKSPNVGKPKTKTVTNASFKNVQMKRYEQKIMEQSKAYERKVHEAKQSSRKALQALIKKDAKDPEQSKLAAAAKINAVKGSEPTVPAVRFSTAVTPRAPTTPATKVDMSSVAADMLRMGANTQYLNDLSSKITNHVYNELLDKCYPEQKEQADEVKTVKNIMKMQSLMKPEPGSTEVTPRKSEEEPPKMVEITSTRVCSPSPSRRSTDAAQKLMEEKPDDVDNMSKHSRTSLSGGRETFIDLDSLRGGYKPVIKTYSKNVLNNLGRAMKVSSVEKIGAESPRVSSQQGESTDVCVEEVKTPRMSSNVARAVASSKSPMLPVMSSYVSAVSAKSPVGKSLKMESAAYPADYTPLSGTSPVNVGSRIGVSARGPLKISATAVPMSARNPDSARSSATRRSTPTSVSVTTPVRGQQVSGSAANIPVPVAAANNMANRVQFQAYPSAPRTPMSGTPTSTPRGSPGQYRSPASSPSPSRPSPMEGKPEEVPELMKFKSSERERNLKRLIMLDEKIKRMEVKRTTFKQPDKDRDAFDKTLVNVLDDMHNKKAGKYLEPNRIAMGAYNRFPKPMKSTCSPRQMDHRSSSPVSVASQNMDDISTSPLNTEVKVPSRGFTQSASLHGPLDDSVEYNTCRAFARGRKVVEESASQEKDIPIKRAYRDYVKTSSQHVDEQEQDENQSDVARGRGSRRAEKASAKEEHPLKAYLRPSTPPKLNEIVKTKTPRTDDPALKAKSSLVKNYYKAFAKPVVASQKIDVSELDEDFLEGLETKPHRQKRKPKLSVATHKPVSNKNLSPRRVEEASEDDAESVKMPARKVDVKGLYRKNAKASGQGTPRRQEVTDEDEDLDEVMPKPAMKIQPHRGIAKPKSGNNLEPVTPVESSPRVVKRMNVISPRKEPRDQFMYTPKLSPRQMNKRKQLEMVYASTTNNTPTPPTTSVVPPTKVNPNSPKIDPTPKYDDVQTPLGHFKLPPAKRKNILPHIPELQNVEIVVPKKNVTMTKPATALGTRTDVVPINPPPFGESFSKCDFVQPGQGDLYGKVKDKSIMDDYEEQPTSPSARPIDPDANAKLYMPYALKFQRPWESDPNATTKSTQFDEKKSKHLKCFQDHVKQTVQAMQYQVKEHKEEEKKYSVTRKAIHPYTNTFGRHLIRLRAESDADDKPQHKNAQDYQKALAAKLKSLSTLPRIKEEEVNSNTDRFVYRPPAHKGGIRDARKPSLTEMKRTIMKHLRETTPPTSYRERPNATV